MRDLDFEQTVAFDAVEDFEFTRKAAQKFRPVVSLDSFEDEDADVIFHERYKDVYKRQHLHCTVWVSRHSSPFW